MAPAAKAGFSNSEFLCAAVHAESLPSRNQIVVCVFLACVCLVVNMFRSIIWIFG